MRFSHLLMACAAGLLLSTAAQAGTVNDVAHDKRGGSIRDHRDGCVRTKWEGASDECGQVAGKAAGNSFLVFFDFDKSKLTAEARNIVKQAAAEAKASGAKSVLVIGHADRAGSNKYNDRLSQHRANAVKKALVKQGVPAGKIKVSAKGESAPLVATDDGVREPQNRRVEISFEK